MILLLFFPLFLTAAPIGVVLSLSGPMASLGQETKKGIELAWSTLPHKDHTLIFEDNQSLVEKALSSTQKLIFKDKVSVIIGDVGSKITQSIAQLTEKNHVVLVSPGATSSELPMGKEYFVQMCFQDIQQSYSAASFIKDTLKLTDGVGLVQKDSDYSQGIYQGFEKKFKELGGTLKAPLYYLNNETDFHPYLQKIRKDKPKFIYFPGHLREAELFLSHIPKDFIPVLGADDFDDPKLWKSLKNLPLNFSLYLTTHAILGKNQDTFTSDFKTKFNERPGHMAALGYDSMALVLKNLNKKTPIMESLKKMGSYKGITGTISFNKDKPSSKTVFVGKLQNEELSLIKEYNSIP